MKKYLRNSQLLLPVLIVSLFFCTATMGQKTWTRAAGNDNWSSANNWNPVGVPAASDAVIIPDNALFTFVNVNINTSCASLTINGGVHPLTITIKTGVTFNVTNTSGGTGLISIGAPADGSSNKIIIVGEPLGLHTSPVLNCVGVTMADVILPFTDDIILKIMSGIVAVSGNLTLNGASGENEVTIYEGKLVVGGTFNNGGSFSTGIGTVEYNGANQVMRGATYNNLTVSGSGAKSTAVTVNATLSIQGTATVTNTITYGSDAFLEYKGSMAQITSNIEFPANMPAKVIINNPAAVGLNSNKTIATELTLLSGTLIAGNKLSMGAAGTPVIRRSGGTMTGTLQSPANDYDVVYSGNSKTTGPELSSGGLKNIYVQLYNPLSMETLTLDQNRIPDGDLYISYGTFNLSIFTINRSAAGGVLTVANTAILKMGGVNSLPLNYTYTLSQLSAVEYAGTNQTVTAANYTNLVASGSGTKTVSTVADTYISGQLTVQPGVAFTVGGANFKVGASTIINGTLNSTSTTGTKAFAYMNINSGGLFNSIVNEDYEVFGDLIINPSGSFIAGLGKWTFFSPGFDLIKGTATFKSVYLNRYYHLEGNLSFSKLEIGPGGTITNKGTLTISELLTGECIFYQLENSVLNFGGTAFKISLLKANVPGNGSMVNFTRQGDQSIVEDPSPNLPPGEPTEYNYYFEGLTFSGSGIKRFEMLTRKANINEKLSIQGTAGVYTAANEILTFGATSTLEYAGSVPQTTTDKEFKSTGGPKNLIINNPSGVTLHASRNIDGTVTLSNGILHIPASNILTIANGNAIGGTGFGTAKHINTQVSGANQGFLRVDKIAPTSSYLFPLGNGTYYLPSTLTPSDIIANNTFSAAVFQGITDNGLPGGNAVTNKSNMVDAVWTINNNIASTTLPVNIVFGWSGLEGVNFSALADNLIGIAHYDNPAWGDFTGSGNQINNTAARFGVTTFSPFAVGQLGVFNSALIAAPHSSAMDMLTPGAMFKGLKSDAKSTAGKKDMQLMSVFPNPVSNQLQLYFAVNKNDKVQLAIIAADGKTVYSKAIKLQLGKSSTILDVSGFLKGTYFARALFEDGQIASIKFIK